MTDGRVAAITGASGCIGRALLERLVPVMEVKALFRSQDRLPASLADRGCHVVPGGLDNQAALAELVEGVDTVFHCAAEMGKRDARLSHEVNVVGTEALARTALRAGTSRFVYVSSISVYGATFRGNQTYTEDMVPENLELLNPYSSTKYQGEGVVRALARTEGLAYTIIRPTNVYGPRSRPWFLQFERMLRWVPIAIGDLLIDVVHVDDLVEGMVQAAASPAASNLDFNLGHEMVALNQFILEVARVTNRKAWKVPPRLDGILRRLVSGAYERFTGKPLSMPLAQARYYPHDKAREVFGYSPVVGLREGFKRIAAWDRAGRP